MQNIETILNPAPIYHLLNNFDNFALIVKDNKDAEKLMAEIELLSSLKDFLT